MRSRVAFLVYGGVWELHPTSPPLWGCTTDRYAGTHRIISFGGLTLIRFHSIKQAPQRQPHVNPLAALANLEHFHPDALKFDQLLDRHTRGNFCCPMCRISWVRFGSPSLRIFQRTFSESAFFICDNSPGHYNGTRTSYSPPPPQRCSGSGPVRSPCWSGPCRQ